MIREVVETWHRVAAGGAGRSAGGRRRLLLGDRLHPTARQGRYDDLPPCGRPHAARRPVHGAFHYTKQVVAGDLAML
jgi:hypothetical protein